MFSGTILPAAEILARIEAVSAVMDLGSNPWRTDRGGTRTRWCQREKMAGDDTVVVRTNGQNLEIGYVADGEPSSNLNPAQCQAITLAGKQ